MAFVAFGVPESVGPEGSSASASGGDFTVHLKNRRFTPDRGVERALAREIESRSDGVVHAIVQLYGPPTQEQRALLAAQGVRLLSYVPNNSWLASVPADVDQLRNLDAGIVRSAVRLRPGDKLSQTLRGGGVPPWAKTSEGRAALVLRFFDDVDPTTAAGVIAAHGGESVGPVRDARKLRVTLPIAEIAGLAAEDSVQWLESVPPPPVAYNDGVRAVANVGPVHAAPYGLSGAGVVAAMWDAGRVGDHVDFEARVTNQDGGGFSNHATHVAGTMAGAGVQVSQYKGVAPGATVLAYKWNNNLAEHQAAANRVLSCIVLDTYV